MIVAPCSMRSLSEIAHGITSNLLTRAADVVLKERRKLVLVARETPLHAIHLRNMTTLAEMGAVIAPPVPAFYNKPRTLDDIVDHTIGRLLDQRGEPDVARRLVAERVVEVLAAYALHGELGRGVHRRAGRPRPAVIADLDAEGAADLAELAVAEILDSGSRQRPAIGEHRVIGERQESWVGWSIRFRPT